MTRSESNQHSELVKRVREGIGWHQDAQWDGYVDADEALNELVEQLEALQETLAKTEQAVDQGWHKAGVNLVRAEKAEEQLEALRTDVDAWLTTYEATEREWMTTAEDLKEQLETAQVERQDALDLHSDCHESWKALHEQLEAAREALQRIHDRSLNPDGSPRYEAASDDALVARAVLYPASEPKEEP